jgi:hypothetical protein
MESFSRCVSGTIQKVMEKRTVQAPLADEKWLEDCKIDDQQQEEWHSRQHLQVCNQV